MGLYIDMEMPKEIEPALVIDFCEDLDGRRYARFYHYRYGGLTDWHEVLEVPEQHGRLIDADAQISLVDTRGGKVEVTVAHIIEKNQGIVKAIIPASEEVST